MLRYLSACLICCVAASSAFGGKPSFRWLSDPNDASITVRPSAISADGKVVVGNLEGRGVHDVFRWTAGGGLATLPDPLSGGEFSGVDDVSDDGSVVIGNSSEDAGDFPDIVRPVRWTMESDTEPLAGIEIGVAHAVSGDGKVILGITGPYRNVAFRWTEEQGAVNLAELCDGFVSGTIAGLNYDGSTIVGTRMLEGNVLRPFSLSVDGCALLDESVFGNIRARALKVSDDGSTIIGSENHGRSGFPFRWNAEDGYALLADNSVSDARNLTSDGSVVIGNQFIWSEHDGYRTLVQLVEDELGVPARSFDISFLNGVDISGDGRTIVGLGGNQATGRQDGFILTVPEPSTWTLGLASIAFLAMQRRYRRRLDTAYHQVRLGSQGQ